jgi:hypothetical protein
MRTEAEIKKEIDTMEDFILKYGKFFDNHGIGIFAGKIEALFWVLSHD